MNNSMKMATAVAIIAILVGCVIVADNASAARTDSPVEIGNQGFNSLDDALTYAGTNPGIETILLNKNATMTKGTLCDVIITSDVRVTLTFTGNMVLKDNVTFDNVILAASEDNVDGMLMNVGSDEISGHVVLTMNRVAMDSSVAGKTIYLTSDAKAEFNGCDFTNSVVAYISEGNVPKIAFNNCANVNMDVNSASGFTVGENIVLNESRVNTITLYSSTILTVPSGQELIAETINASSTYSGSGLVAEGTVKIKNEIPVSVHVSGSTSDWTDVTQIGDVTYPTLKDAVADVPEGVPTTITMIDDYFMDQDELITIAQNQKITLDLNGNTITVNSGDSIRPIINNGTLTITGNGIIDTSKGASFGTVGNYGTLTIENGRFIGDYTQHGTLIRTYSESTTTIVDGYFLGSPGAVYNEGTCTIVDGEYISTSCVTCHSTSWAYTVRNMGGDMTIEYAKVTGTQGALCTAEGTLTVNGGVYQTVHCPSNPDHNTSAHYALYVAGEEGPTSAVVYDGSFTSYNKTAVLVGNSADGGIEASAILSVYGGSFKVSNNPNVAIITVDNNTANDPDASIYGGDFDRAPNEELLAPGYTINFSNGVYTADEVTPEQSVAEVDGVYFETFADAIEYVPEGGTVKLTKDASTGTIEINKGINLNLGGFTLSIVGTDVEGITFTHGANSIKNGTIIDTRSNGNDNYNYRAVTVIGSGTTMELDANLATYYPDAANYNYVLRIRDGADVTMNGGSIYEIDQICTNTKTYGAVGVGVFGTPASSSDSTTFTMNGGSITVGAYGIAGNGSVLNADGSGDDYSNTVITVNDGIITVDHTQAIYHPQAGTLNIYGGSISGTAGIEMRSGTLNMSGGTVSGMMDKLESEPNGNGSTTYGAGIAVIQHTTKQDIQINITGGNIEGYVALYQANTQNNPNPDNIDMSVSGGEFVGKKADGNSSILAYDVSGFVTGGTFLTRDDNGNQSGDTTLNEEGKNILAEGRQVSDEGTVEPTTVDITISVSPSFASFIIYANGEPIGTYTGSTTQTLTIGSSYTVVCTADGYDTKSYSFTANAGTTSYTITMEESEPITPPVYPGDDDDYVPIPPAVVDDSSSDDDTVKIVACAAAAVVAAIIAAFLILGHRRD